MGNEWSGDMTKFLEHNARFKYLTLWSTYLSILLRLCDNTQFAKMTYDYSYRDSSSDNWLRYLHQLTSLTKPNKKDILVYFNYYAGCNKRTKRLQRRLETRAKGLNRSD